MFIERRKEERIVPHDSVFLKLPFTYPKNQEIVKPVIDISPSGLSFKMDEEDGYLLPGSPLRNITIFGHEYEKTIPNSIVRNSVHIENNAASFNRIGIEFLIKPFEKSVIRRKVLNSYRLRMPRYNSDLTPLLSWKISFIYNGQNAKSTSIINFSKFGIAFQIKETPMDLKKSDVLQDFRIKIDDELIYEGEVTIADLEDNTNGLIVRCSLRKGNIDMEKISLLNSKSKSAEDINTFFHQFSKIENIDSEFKADIADLRHFLEKLESRLAVEDQKIDSAGIREDYATYYKEKLLDNILKSAFKKLDKFFNNLRIRVSNFHQVKYDLYKYYFQEHLHHFFLKSPFVNRSYNKPLGYAGDYETMNMLYTNPYAGNNLFSKLINRHSWEQTAARAVRNRIPYLIDKFNALINSSFNGDSKYIRVMSVGSGPAAEIQEVIKQNKDIDRFVFTLVDADTEALLYCQDKLLNMIGENGLDININFVNKAVDQLIKDKDLVSRLGKYDLIYSMGLFDYLSIPVIKRLTKRLYEFLNDNGKLVIGNFNYLNDTKTYMEYLLDWYLFHRSEEEMLKFIEKIRNPKKVYFETDDTKITNFLIIAK